VTLLGPDLEHADWSEARLRNLIVSFGLMPSSMFYDLIDQQKRQTEALHRCSELLERAELRVLVSKIFPLEEAPEAHRYIEQSNTTRKFVLLVDVCSANNLPLVERILTCEEMRAHIWKHGRRRILELQTLTIWWMRSSFPRFRIPSVRI
jgi:hypothetical protein